MTDDQRLAERFWRLAGGAPPFPSDVASSAAWALPLVIVEEPSLTVATIGAWLMERDILTSDLPNRPLRACLVARAGSGVIFLDADDPPDERRYSAAHEVAHFLRDHLAPRDEAEGALGHDALDVLDGLRPATNGERIEALFADVLLRPLTHLLDRNDTGDCRSFATAEAEAAADRLALELIAPRQEAERRLRDFPRRSSDSSVEQAAATLAGDFGLPSRVARPYAWSLLAARDDDQPLRDLLGLSDCSENFESRRRTSGVRPEPKS